MFDSVTFEGGLKHFSVSVRVCSVLKVLQVMMFVSWCVIKC